MWFKLGHLSFISWGQCEIIPASHCSSIVRSDEECLVEIARYKSCLESMFEREGMSVLFLESAVRNRSLPKTSYRDSTGEQSQPNAEISRHAVIDAIPIKQKDMKEAITYFREVVYFCPHFLILIILMKAFLHCDTEWSTHKKLIDLTLDVNCNGSSFTGMLHKKIPGKMNYVSVEWSGGGYAHVVENEEDFNEDFCLDIMSGFFEVLIRHIIHIAPFNHIFFRTCLFT